MALFFFPLPRAPYQTGGRSTLTLLQSDSMMPLDLLVREAVQNSLDAAQKEAESVNISFNIREHSCDMVADLLPELKAGLKRRYGSSPQQMLEVRDSNTEGLTGPIGLDSVPQTDKDDGNFVKLVYDITKPREEHHSGGSWGLGKTVYYRLGCGLVIYYSRISENNRFAERLAVCFAEDEKSNDRLIQSSVVPTGIAWWGGKFPRGKVWPHALTDSKEIRKILKLLGVKEFTGDETGTAVIIPFLRNDLIKSSADDDEDTGDLFPMNRINSQPYWFNNYHDYISVAVQRWYAVRLNNKHYPREYGPFLTVAVNGKKITEKCPIFDIITLLYNYNNGKEDQKSIKFFCGIPDKDRYLKMVSPTGIFDKKEGTCAGHIIAVRLDRKDLKTKEYLSPFEYISSNNEPEKPYPPICVYLRQPGMIISWSDNEWSRSYQGDLDGKYTIALFVPETEKSLSKEIRKKTGKETLGEYLRSCEKADHASWSDKSGFNIVDKIRKNFRSQLQDAFQEKNAAVTDSVDMTMARLLADKFLPDGYGHDSRERNVIDKVGGAARRLPGPKGLYSSLALLGEPSYSPEGIKIEWSLYWGKGGVRSHILGLSVATENSALTPEKWNEDISLGVFPFRFSRITVSEKYNAKQNDKTSEKIKLELCPTVKTTGIATAENSKILLKSNGTTIEISLLSEDEMDGATLKGTLIIQNTAGSIEFQPVLGLTDHNTHEGAV